MYEVTIHYLDGSSETIARLPSEQEAIRRGQAFVYTTRRYPTWASEYVANDYTVNEVEE